MSANLPFTDITQKELDELDEYSCSTPTDTTPGKRWKRDLRAYEPPDPKVDKAVSALAAQMRGPEWIIGEFFEPTEEDRTLRGWSKDDIGIRWAKPHIVP